MTSEVFTHEQHHRLFLFLFSLVRAHCRDRLAAVRAAGLVARHSSLLRLLLGLLGEQDGLDVGQHTALSDGDAGEQLVELLVVSDGQLQVARNDAGLLVVTGGVPGELEHLSRQVLENRGQVDGSSGPDALGVVSLAEQTVDSSHGELEPGTAGPGLALPLHLSALAATRHAA